MSTYIRPLADTVGIASSGLCALHCMLLPISVFAGSIGAFSGFAGLADESVHLALVGIAAPAAALALGIGFQQHRDGAIVLRGAVGVALLIASATVLHSWTGEIGERLAAAAAACFLISAHLQNRRRCRSGLCKSD
ncbi:MAG: MerC domain-containing protein [Myxococcota bacterium]